MSTTATVNAITSIIKLTPMKRFFKTKRKCEQKTAVAAEAGEDSLRPQDEWNSRPQDNTQSPWQQEQDVALSSCQSPLDARLQQGDDRLLPWPPEACDRPHRNHGANDDLSPRQPDKSSPSDPSSKQSVRQNHPGNTLHPRSHNHDNTQCNTQLDLSNADLSNYGNRDWFIAVTEQNLEEVHRFVDNGFPVDSKDAQGWSALHLCAWNDYADVCEVLLRSGAEVDVRAVGGSTPLSLAAERGHTTIIQCLLEAGCDPTLTCDLADCRHVTALHLAAQHGHTDVTGHLLRAGAVVNAMMSAHGIDGVTPLHLAVQNDHLDVMDLLIGAGCDVQSSTTSAQKSANNKESSC